MKCLAREGQGLNVEGLQDLTGLTDQVSPNSLGDGVSESFGSPRGWAFSHE